MRIRLEPSDEYMHGDEGASTFNESMYFNVFQPDGLGAFFRLGNRPNEGYAEMTVCLYLPRGRVGFMFARPEIKGNDAFDAGGMRFEVVEPYEELRIAYEGKVALLEDPRAMKDPRKAFTEAPHVACSAELVCRGVSPMWGGEPEFEEGEEPPEGMEFAKGHYEQHTATTGDLVCGDESFAVDGHGLRDHSWGPRRWQAPHHYRWLTCGASGEDGFMVSVVATGPDRVRRTGILFADGEHVPITDARLETDWTDEDVYQDRIRCVATTPSGDVEITGEVESLIPLRNRREGRTTRITEGLTRYTWDGQEAYGISEYLDQIVDGRPVGA